MALTTKKCARGLDGVLVCFPVYYCPLSAPSALSPLTVLPVVRSAPHGRRLLMGLATTSFILPIPFLPFFLTLCSHPPFIPFPNCPSTYSPTLCGRPSFYCLYSISFLLSYSPSPTFLLLHPPFFSFPLSYYTITTFLSPSHSSTYDDLIR